MRQAGQSGAAIMQKLIETNEAFDSKTAFSQRKFLRRKANVHLRRVRVERVSAQAVFVALQEGAVPALLFARALTLRWDAASMLLSLANVRPRGRSLIFDDTMGVLSAMVVERQGQGTGGLTVVAARGGRTLLGLATLNCDLNQVLCTGGMQIRPVRRRASAKAAGAKGGKRRTMSGRDLASAAIRDAQDASQMAGEQGTQASIPPTLPSLSSGASCAGPEAGAGASHAGADSSVPAAASAAPRAVRPSGEGHSIESWPAGSVPEVLAVAASELVEYADPLKGGLVTAPIVEAGEARSGTPSTAASGGGTCKSKSEGEDAMVDSDGDD